MNTDDITLMALYIQIIIQCRSIIYIRVLQLHQIDSEFLHLYTGSPMPIKHAYGIQVPKPDVGQMASFQGHDTHTGGVDYICH